MNDAGREYIRSQNEALAKSPNKSKFKNIVWTESLFQERLMRFGVEFKKYELDMLDTCNIEKIMRATFIEDHIRWDKHLETRKSKL